jgi:hypothetical protein
MHSSGSRNEGTTETLHQQSISLKTQSHLRESENQSL